MNPKLPSLPMSKHIGGLGIACGWAGGAALSRVRVSQCSCAFGAGEEIEARFRSRC